MYSQLKIDNEKFRFDDEFFLKKYLRAYSIVKENTNIKFDSIIDVLTDFHANGSYENIAQVFSLLDNKDYAYMVRTTDLEKKDYTNDVKYISKESYEYLSKSKLFGGELLINKIGVPGKVYLMPKLGYPCSLGMNLFMIRLKDQCSFSTQFLWVFFNTEIGKNIIHRKINGTVPLTIDKEAIRSLYIPLYSKNFQNIIAKIVKDAEYKIDQATIVYQQAENVLNKFINIPHAALNNNFYNIKTIAQSYHLNGRLDAEYYQSKYDNLFALLSKFETKKLGNIVQIIKSIEPGSDVYLNTGIPFIRVSDISKFGISETNIYLSSEEYNDVIRPKQDTILLSKDGSVGIAYKVEEDLDVITSGAILHLTVTDNEFMPDYLTLVLNSPIVRMQAERDAGGSIIQHWKPSEIEDVIIPKLSKEFQSEIANKVRESFVLRKESQRLLELAKTAVETAIEQGEDVALNILKQNRINRYENN